MLKKLRLKFICVIMTVVTVLLCVIFGLVLHFTAQSLEEQTIQQLARSVQGGMKPGRPGDRPPEQLSCFTVEKGPDGELIARGSELYDLSDHAFLQELMEQALESGKETGVLRAYTLRYLVKDTPHGKTVAFTDITAQQRTWIQLAWICLFTGVLSFALLLFASIFLARWAVRPVEQAWQEQRQFVADASHELKTPLTVIMTNAQLLEAAPPEDPRIGQFTESILSTSRQMRTLVESMLELARLDNGGEYTQELDLSQTVSEAALPFDAVFFEAGLELKTQITPNIHVRGSSSHLRQVAEILLDNARKYATANTQVVLVLEPCGKDCRLTVSNAGPAISPEDQKNIFHRFYRTDRVRTMSDSYGLGLPIAQSIVREHRGRIWVQSKGGYNSFFVQLPQVNPK